MVTSFSTIKIEVIEIKNMIAIPEDANKAERP